MRLVSAEKEIRIIRDRQPEHPMYIESVSNRGSPPAILLRESYRDGGKVKKRTLLNLSDWSLPGSVPLRAGGAVRGNHMARPRRVSPWRDQ